MQWQNRTDQMPVSTTPPPQPRDFANLQSPAVVPCRLSFLISPSFCLLVSVYFYSLQSLSFSISDPLCLGLSPSSLPFFICVLFSPSLSLCVHRMELPKSIQLKQGALNHTVSQWTHLNKRRHRTQRHPCRDRCTQDSHVGTYAHLHPHPLLVTGYFKFSVGENGRPQPQERVGAVQGAGTPWQEAGSLETFSSHTVTCRQLPTQWHADRQGDTHTHTSDTHTLTDTT